MIALALLAPTAAFADTKPPKQPVIAPATAALIPETGWLVSYRLGDEKYAVARITKTGVKELLRADENGNTQMMWLDAKTLVSVGVDFDHNIEVRWIVDGVVDAKRTIKHKAAVWGLKSEEDFLSILGASRGADGSLWIERCLQEDGPDCGKSSWTRVDTATPTTVKKRPKKLTAFSESVVAPKVEAPAGYSAKIVKIKSTVSPKSKVAAVECTGPKGKVTWSQESPPIDPAERYTPKKLRWISATPPLLEVEGIAVNPVGQEDTVPYVFRECAAAPYNSVTWIGDHAWSYDNRDDDTITIMVDDKTYGTLSGRSLIAAPK
jgi:hypothetical protein